MNHLELFTDRSQYRDEFGIDVGVAEGVIKKDVDELLGSTSEILASRCIKASGGGMALAPEHRAVTAWSWSDGPGPSGETAGTSGKVA